MNGYKRNNINSYSIYKKNKRRNPTKYVYKLNNIQTKKKKKKLTKKKRINAEKKMESTKLFKTNIKQTKNAKISCQSAKKMRKKETKKKTESII